MASKLSEMSPVESAILAWANARDRAELRTLIETRNDDLNTPAADQLLGELLENYAGQGAVVDQLRRRRHLLYRCRTEGVHAAFASEAPQFDSHTFETVHEFLISSSDEVQRIFLEHREILESDEAQRVLEHLERYHQDDPELRGRVRDRRDRIRVAIDRGVDKAFPIFSNRQALQEAFIRLVETPDWPTKLEIIRAEAALLLSDEADRFVEALLSVRPGRGDVMYQTIAFHRGILARARRDGVESIRFDGGLPPSSAGVSLTEAERAKAEELLALIRERHGHFVPIHEDDMEHMLQKRPDLRKAWEHLRPWSIFINPDDADRAEFDRLVEELKHCSDPNLTEHRVHLMRRALQIPFVQQFPALCAAFHADLAAELLSCPGKDRAAVLEEAFNNATLAESLWSKDKHLLDWALNRWSMGNILTHRMVGGREKNIEKALECFKSAGEILDAENSPGDRVTRYISLANAYSMRVVGSTLENIEAALRYLRLAINDEAFQSLSAREQGDAWAILGNTLCQRIAGEQADNVEEALHALRRAQQCFKDAEVPERLGLNHYCVAVALTLRQYGDPEENRREALKLIDACLQLCTREQWPERWAQATMARGSLTRSEARTREELNEAFQSYRSAQTYLTRATSPNDWATIEKALGAALLSWVWATGQLEDLEEAIQHLRSALEVFHRESDALRWSELHLLLGSSHALLAKAGVPDAMTLAEAHYRLSLVERPADSFPSEHSESQAALGGILLATGRWEEAHSALSESIEAGMFAFDTAYTEMGRHAAIARVSALFAEDAYALVRLQRYAEALVRLDAGKTRMLAQSLALSGTDLAGLDLADRAELQKMRDLVRQLEGRMRIGDFGPTRPVDRDTAAALKEARARLAEFLHRVRTRHPEFLAATLALPELLALPPPGGALVAPIVATHGAVVFVIPHGTTEVTEKHVVRIDSFTRANLIELLQGKEQGALGGWLKVYDEQTQHWQAWLDGIEHTGRALWEALFGAVCASLEALGVREGAPVVLIPQGGLALLPTHAAWREVGGRKRCIVEDYTLSYAPSGYALAVSRRRAESASTPRALLAVINPTGDLTYAQSEGEALEVIWGAACRPLRQCAATLDVIREAAPSHTYLHFCCHGECDWNDPMKSGLVLAGRQRLTLAEVLGTFDLSRTRLVTLSACETGITDIRRMPDEYIGLAAGFLYAGAAAVISTLWPVDDLSTMLLMERFYRLHISEGEQPAAALCKAQRWIRDATDQEFAQYLQPFQSAQTDGPQRTYRMAWERFAERARTQKERRPFEHPYYWAGFVLNGV